MSKLVKLRTVPERGDTNVGSPNWSDHIENRLEEMIEFQGYRVTDSTELNAAISAIGSNFDTINIGANFIVSSNITTHANTRIVIPQQYKVTVAATYTLTINGPLWAEGDSIDGSGSYAANGAIFHTTSNGTSIGKLNPAEALDVGGNVKIAGDRKIYSDSDWSIELHNGLGSGSRRMVFNTADDADGGGALFKSGGSNIAELTKTGDFNAIGELSSTTMAINTDKLVVLADGKVGINKTPTTDFDVNGQIASTTLAVNTNKLIVLADGKVGIGKTPTVELDLNGSLMISGDLTVNGTTTTINTEVTTTDQMTIIQDENQEALIIQKTATGAGIPLKIENAGTSPAVTIMATGSGNGNVGIGTINPGAKVEINEPTSANCNVMITARGGNDLTCSTYYRVKNSSAADRGGIIGSDGTLDGGLILSGDTSLASRHMYISPNGYIGVGKIPDRPLDIERSTNGIAKFKSTDNDGHIIISDDDTDTYVSAEGGISYLGRYGGANAKNIAVNINGSFGVGTAAMNSTIHAHSSSNVEIASRFTNNVTGLSNGLVVGTNASGKAILKNVTNTDMGLYTNNQERIVILANGSVGIAKAPIDKFEVNGNTGTTGMFKSAAESTLYQSWRDYKYDQSGGGNTYYHLIGWLDDASAANGCLTVEGSIGGHENTDGKAFIRVVVNLRNSEIYNGFIQGDLGASDIKIYKYGNRFNVYLTTGDWAQVLMSANVTSLDNTRGQIVFEAPSITVPSGSLKYTLSTGYNMRVGNDGNTRIKDLYVTEKMIHTGDENTYIRFTNDNMSTFVGGIDRLHMYGGETVFNEGGVDKDFRVEATGAPKAIFIDGANGNTMLGGPYTLINDGITLGVGMLGIGITGTPNTLGLQVHRVGVAGIALTNNTTGSTSNDGLKLVENGVDAKLWNFENGYLKFGTNDAEVFRITSTGTMDLYSSAGFTIQQSDDTKGVTIKSHSDQQILLAGGAAGSIALRAGGVTGISVDVNGLRSGSGRTIHVIASSSAPVSTTTGGLWYDTNANALKVYDGGWNLV